MIALTIDDLKKENLESRLKYEKLNLFVSSSVNLSALDLSALKETLLDILSFGSVAVRLTEAVDKEIRSEFKNLFSSKEREQVLKHTISDLWGQALTLEKSFAALIKSCEKPTRSPEIEINFDSFYRTALDAILNFERFNNTELKSELVTKLIQFSFSLIKSNDIRSLSAKAGEDIKQIA